MEYILRCCNQEFLLIKSGQNCIELTPDDVTGKQASPQPSAYLLAWFQRLPVPESWQDLLDLLPNTITALIHAR